MPTPAEIQAAIGRYATAYAALQRMQERSPLIPIGDQKTGSIGEFYVRLYLGARYPEASIAYGGHSESGWDLEVSTPARQWRVQVKTVSAFAKLRRISPIKAGWDELHIIFLDHAFWPAAFWVIEDPACMVNGAALKNQCCPNPTTGKGGSVKLAFGPNRLEELLKCISPCLEAAPALQ